MQDRVFHAEARRDAKRRLPAFITVPFAVLLVALFGLFAVAIDLGLQSMTRRQMQTAVDSAALEGLRGRDDASPQADLNRRIEASQIVAYHYDDNLNINVGDVDPIERGAGPLFTVTGGVGKLDALALEQTGNPAFPVGQTTYLERSFEPNTGQPIWLQTNVTDNFYYGDMVAGDYDANQSHLDGRFVGLTWQPYDRKDFDATAAGRGAFLVRMRRTENVVPGLDRVDGASTTGPGIPFLFARGSIIQGPDDANGQSPRRQGLSVRGTAIARQQTAKSIGAAYPERGMLGVAPVSFELAYWLSLPTAILPTISDTVLVDGVAGGGTGQMTSILNPPGQRDGQVFRATTLAGPIAPGATTMDVASTEGFPVPPNFVFRPFRARIGNEVLSVTGAAGTTWTIDPAVQSHAFGDRVAWSVSAAIATPMSINQGRALNGLSIDPSGEDFYVPVFATLTGAFPTIEVVVGFGLAHITPTGVPDVFEVSKLSSRMAPANASASANSDWYEQVEKVVGVLSPSQRAAFLDGPGGVLKTNVLNFSPATPVPPARGEGVLAPALVQAYGGS